MLLGMNLIRHLIYVTEHNDVNVSTLDTLSTNILKAGFFYFSELHNGD